MMPPWFAKFITNRPQPQADQPPPPPVVDGASIAGDVGNSIEAVLAKHGLNSGSSVAGSMRPRGAAVGQPAPGLGELRQVPVSNEMRSNAGPQMPHSPPEGSLEWFAQATPEQLRAYADKTKAMVKMGK